MTRKLLFSFVLSLFAVDVFAQVGSAPTWSSDVACIIYSHCSSCHNPNSIAPFSLLTYQDALSERVNIKYYVSNKLMPPYLPNTNYQHYTDMRNLTDQEINTIVAWANAGGPQGDSTTVLPQPTFPPQGPVLTHPDLTGRIPTFTVPSTGSDLYQCFVITPPQDSLRYIKTIEVIPGNKNAVHHVLIFADTSYIPVVRDSLTGGHGYVNFGGTGSNTSQMVGGWVPGAGIDSMPPGMGLKLMQGARIIIQIHYPVTAAGMTDSTRINFQYTSTNNVRNVSVASILNYYSTMTDGPLRIPADSVKTFHEKYTVPGNATILSIAPHGHLVCTALKSFAVTPVGDTIPLIDIPRWDFHWQGVHPFQKPIKIPTGSKLWGIGTYDNTYNNPDAPQPLATVTAGEATTDEMMLFFFWYLPYQTGDENIIVDTASHQTHYQNCTVLWPADSSGTSTGISVQNPNSITMIYPNPAQNILNYYTFADLDEISIMDITGQQVKLISTNSHGGQISLSGMSSGLYFLRVHFVDGTSELLRFTKD